MTDWIRVNECKLCQKPLCAINADNPKVGYCKREERFFFLNNDGLVYLTSKKHKGFSPQSMFDFERKERSKKKPAVEGVEKQVEFDF